MRHWLLLIAALVPMVVQAKDVDLVAQWTYCEQDSDCVVIKGMCGPAAAQAGYAEAAEQYFKLRAEKVKCVQKFWEPKPEGAAARCRVQRCEIVGKASGK